MHKASGVGGGGGALTGPSIINRTQYPLDKQSPGSYAEGAILTRRENSIHIAHVCRAAFLAALCIYVIILVEKYAGMIIVNMSTIKDEKSLYQNMKHLS